MSSGERKIGDRVKLATGPLGIAPSGWVYTHEFNPDNSTMRELAWAEESREHPREFGVTWMRLVRIGPWKDRLE